MTNQTQTPPPPPEQSKSGSSSILIAGVIIILLVALGAILFLVFRNNGANPPAGAATPVPPEIALPTAEPGVPMVTALEPVNVRSGPNTNFPSYGVAPAGSQGVVIGVSEDGGWWVVQVNRTDLVPDGQGWVSADYVEASNTEGVPVVPSPEQPPIVEVPPPDPDAPKATALDAINVRSGPGTNYASYGIAPKGARGEVIGVSEDGQWWVVKLPTSLVGAGQGWVSADWVFVENAQGVPVIPAPPQ